MSDINESFNLLLKETVPVIEHTATTMQKIFDEYSAELGKEVKIDRESHVDICTHLAMVYHMLVVSVSEAICESKDINKGTQKTLRLIKQLSLHNNEYVSPDMEVEANNLVNSVFAKSRGTA